MEVVVKHFLTYAIERQSGRLVSVNDVVKGLNCNCVCPKCGQTLVAKKGNKRIFHFAHHKGCSCDHISAFESQIHLLCKEIIQEESMVAVPSFVVGNQILYNARLLKFYKVDVEKEDSGGLRPDCIGYLKTKENTLVPVWIEINNTHSVTPEKEKYIYENKIYCIEIDVREFAQKEAIDKAEIRKYLLENIDPSKRRWINFVYQRRPSASNTAVKRSAPSSPQYHWAYNKRTKQYYRVRNWRF